MNKLEFGTQRGRIHVALGVALLVGAVLMLVDRRASLLGLVPFALVAAAIGAYALLHRKAHAWPPRLRRPR